ncbi:hypothetical protein [Corallococcus sp. RDP092CA]|uniref:hypothetical protein n=1 Tax=Corallococcus sp. RDP092CA TaxID=3109369 RepID=UPI0035AEC704
MSSDKLAIGEGAAAVLRACGWEPDRSVPIDLMVQVLKGEGVVVHPVAGAVLRSLGGMRFVGWGNDVLDFDVEEVCRWIDEDGWPYIRRLHGDSACPVAIGEGMIYFVSASGRWMSLHQQWTVCYFIETLNEVLEFALLGRFADREYVALAGEMVPPGYR